ncbi:MAG: signal peptidase I [Patescibacteria group bacterium]|nr:signal peptidase I [Patescibacteria group bacterium]
MNKKKKSIIEFIIYLVFVGAVAIGTPKALVYALGTDYPIASITSGSMWPELKKNDLVLIKYAEKKSLAKGDIVVFKNERGFTIHRIVELNEDTITTKGDANNVSDSPVEYEKIIGKTVNWNNKPVRIPYLGRLTIWASNRR